MKKVKRSEVIQFRCSLIEKNRIKGYSLYDFQGNMSEYLIHQALKAPRLKKAKDGKRDIR